MKQIIRTPLAPKAIGTYSQGVKAGNTVYISGQIPLVPETMALVSPEISAQVEQAFKNLSEVTIAAGGSLKDIVKLTIYLVNLEYFNEVNNAMSKYFEEPYPARAVIGVSSLPKNSQVEVDAIMVLSD